MARAFVTRACHDPHEDVTIDLLAAAETSLEKSLEGFIDILLQVIMTDASLLAMVTERSILTYFAYRHMAVRGFTLMEPYSAEMLRSVSVLICFEYYGPLLLAENCTLLSSAASLQNTLSRSFYFLGLPTSTGLYCLYLSLLLYLPLLASTCLYLPLLASTFPFSFSFNSC